MAARARVAVQRGSLAVESASAEWAGVEAEPDVGRWLGVCWSFGRALPGPSV